MKTIVTSTDGTFDQDVLQSKIPVIVDFFAEWCGPCKMLAPVLEEIALEQADRLKIVKVDVEKSPQLAARYGVSAMPTLIYFVNGEVRQQTRGAAPKKMILKTLEGLSAAA
jgi:thioredoxin 1